MIVSVVALPRSTSPSTDALPETVSPVRVPTFVSEEFTTAPPRVVALRTLVLLILYSLLEARFKFSDAPQLSPVASN